MRHLFYNDAWDYELAILAIAGMPTLERAKGFMADWGCEVSIPALETVQRNKAREIEEARQKLARRERERVSEVLDEALEAHPWPQTG